ncbi:MAG: carotenoid 1,2-hydratase [Rhodopirellula sp.]|nr:carotenoid 1,2-hydratase [Rhodopirellula sp.]
MTGASKGAGVLIVCLVTAAGAGEWKSAVEPHPFRFPEDHAAHENYRIEWWYYTGNLETRDGRRFGYQLTFFRTGVVREPENPSRWTIRDLYTAHFAVSDIDRRQFHFFERVNRRGIGWAGAETDTYHVWNGDWKVRLEGNSHHLVAEQDQCRIALTLSPTKPPVLHGEAGLSQKGPSTGNASHYYSQTRMQTTGLLTVGGREFPVHGTSWMDHEFSTSFLEEGQQGWDWFAVQLDDGRELMIYQIRRADGTPDPHSSGTLVAADGAAVHLGIDQFSLVPGRRWRSGETTATYPIQWTVRVPGQRLEFDVRAAFSDQEMNTIGSTGLAYWEGAVVIEGRSEGKPVRGRGYLEMTGYAGKSLGRVLQSPP